MAVAFTARRIDLFVVYPACPEFRARLFEAPTLVVSPSSMSVSLTVAGLLTITVNGSTLEPMQLHCTRRHPSRE